jgi:Ca-activated chloride channel family protein
VQIGRSRRRRASAYGTLGRMPTISSRSVNIRRRIAGAFVVAGFALLALSLARPESVVSLPRLEGTVILAFDVSGSMAAQDFDPSRMEAARAAARRFVERQPEGVVVGVVAFSDSGFSVQVPTGDPAPILAAIDRLRPERGTSLSHGIASALGVITGDDGETQPVDGGEEGLPALDSGGAPLEPTFNSSAVIVLLTDGENTDESDPLEAAQAAADVGVRIHTVGIGSAEGVTLEVEGFRVHTQLNEPMLQDLAEVTGGTYYHAADSQELASIYSGLNTTLVTRPEKIEVTSLFVGAAVAALIVGAGLSLVWLGRWP